MRTGIWHDLQPNSINPLFYFLKISDGYLQLYLIALLSLWNLTYLQKHPRPFWVRKEENRKVTLLVKTHKTEDRGSWAHTSIGFQPTSTCATSPFKGIKVSLRRIFFKKKSRFFIIKLPQNLYKNIFLLYVQTLR